MTDRLELTIRDHLQAEAAYAPDPAGLATGAIALAHRRRRRTAWRAGATIAVVLALGGTALAVARPGTTPVTPPITASPTPDHVVLDGTLTYRGTSVRVPKAWLDPKNNQCGTALRDAAYIVTVSHSCRPHVEHPERISEVVLMPWTDGSEPYANGTLPDGRTRLTTRVPVSDLRLVVTSPDPALARRIFDTLTVEGQCTGGYWLEASNGRSAAIVDGWTPTLQVTVGDTITLHSSPGCPAASIAWPSSKVLRAVPDNTGGTVTVRAAAPGSVVVNLVRWQGTGGDTGTAEAGSVRVTVVAAASPSR